MRRLLHIVRAGARAPDAAVASSDVVVYIDDIDDDALLDLILAADTVVVW